MINARHATPDQIRRAGVEALVRELGVAGMLRFMQQYEPGHGDYTAERHTLLGNPTVDQLFDEMEKLERVPRPHTTRRRRGRKGRSRG